MLTLFPIVPHLPPGFTYRPEFISAVEEDELMEHIHRIPLKPFVFQGYEAKRRVASFGWDWSFQDRTLKKGRDIPGIFEGLIGRVAEFVQLQAAAFAELLITEYPKGSVINWHRDAPPFELIAGISLATDCLFRLKPYEKEKQKPGSVITVPVQRRSLYIMEGEARSQWQHSIPAVKDHRYSITLRTLRV